jgi:uncharacterized protein (TIGR00255 family)
MTGYARVTENMGGMEHTVEIKTLNHKYIDIKLALARDIENFEHHIGETLRSRLQRGSIRLSYNIKKAGAASKKNKLFEVDLAAAAAYNDAFAKTAKHLKLKYEPCLETIMRQNGVINIVENETAPDKDAVIKLIINAIDALNKFRASEGGRLAKIISSRLKALGALINKIAKFRKEVKDVYYEKLKDRIDSFIKNAKISVEISEDRLNQEIVMMADKSDITEEIDRFLTHIKHFDALLKGNDKDPAIGRKMDFLCQELFREITTLSNKTNLTDITKIAIEVKSELEKIREQIQNIQ